MLLYLWIIWWWYESLHIIKLMLRDFINCFHHQIFAGHVVNAVTPEDSFSLLSYSHAALQYCSTDIPAFEIQLRITGDPVVACVLPKINWCRSKTRSWEKKNPWKTFKTSHLLIICIKNHKYIYHTKILHLLNFYLFINLFTYLFIFLLIHHFFILLEI